MHLEKAESGVLMLYDLHGRPVTEIFSGIFPTGESKYFFDVGKMIPGCYVLELRTDSLRAIEQVVVK